MGSLQLKSVRKSFGNVDVIKGIDLDVKDGEFVVFVGPSGCGKSTLLRIIAGLEDATSGSITIDGAEVVTVPPAKRGIAMVFQSYALYPHLTVKDNMGLGLKQAGAPKDEIEKRVSKASAMLSLEKYLARRPAELSGGQRQRVAIGRAIVREPKIFLFDEPLSNLDARLRREMREEIRAIQQRLQLTVAYVTHDQSEALAVSDQIIVMDHGVIAQQGSPEDLYGRPQSEFVAGFMGEAMVFPALAHGDGTVELGPLRFTPRYPVVTQGPTQVAVRPEAWQMGVASGLPARCTKVAYLGGFYEYGFETSLGTLFVVSTDLARPLAVGESTHMGLGSHGVSVVVQG